MVLSVIIQFHENEIFIIPSTAWRMKFILIKIKKKVIWPKIRSFFFFLFDHKKKKFLIIRLSAEFRPFGFKVQETCLFSFHYIDLIFSQMWICSSTFSLALFWEKMLWIIQVFELISLWVSFASPQFLLGYSRDLWKEKLIYFFQRSDSPESNVGI